MTVGWVAADIRGRALIHRLVGADRARVLAGLDWRDACEALTSTVYGKDLASDAGRTDARYAAMGAAAWQLRVLAGWLPPGNGGLARLFAAPMEITNIESHLRRLRGGGRAEPAIPLGSLAVCWHRVVRADSPEAVRSVLASSLWGDPGGTDQASVTVGLWLRWAHRLAGLSPVVVPWAKGLAAVLLARERFAFGRATTLQVDRVAETLLGRNWDSALSIAEFAQGLPDIASWPFAGVSQPEDLWHAEVLVARRVATDAKQLVETGRRDRDSLVGIMAFLLVDLRRVLAVIELAGRHPDPTKVFDAVA